MCPLSPPADIPEEFTAKSRYLAGDNSMNTLLRYCHHAGMAYSVTLQVQRDLVSLQPETPEEEWKECSSHGETPESVNYSGV